MKFAIVSESYKASTINHTALTQQVSQVTVMEDSLAAFQVILADDQTTWVNVGTTYRFGENLQTPVYRVAVTGDSGLQPVVHLVDYYTDNHGIAYADKIITDEFLSFAGPIDGVALITLPTKGLAVGDYSLTVHIFKSLPGQAETKAFEQKVHLKVVANPLSMVERHAYRVDLWQQPANLAKQFKVALWSPAHFEVIDQMAAMLAQIDQDSVSLVLSDDPWRGWGASFMKTKPADLYEVNMVKVTKSGHQIKTDFTVVDRYLEIFANHGIQTEYDLFGFLGLWDLPFYAAVPNVDYPEKIIIRYLNEDTGMYDFLTSHDDIVTYIKQVLDHFEQRGDWDKVRIMADEPKVENLERFKASMAILQAQIGNRPLNLKVAFNNVEVVKALQDVVAYPVTSLYATTQTLDGQEHLQQEYYVCNMPNRPNSFLARPLGETRLLGALTNELKLGGMLRWAVACWASDPQHDINYNPDWFPVGDMGLIYPLENGTFGYSLRWLMLYRGREDFNLLAHADEMHRQQALDCLFLEHDIASWMVDERTTATGIFTCEDADFDKFRNYLLNNDEVK